MKSDEAPRSDLGEQGRQGDGCPAACPLPTDLHRTFFRAFVITPRSRSIAPSDMTPVCRLRLLRWDKAYATQSGIVPSPNCIVAPSSTSPATFDAIRSSISVAAGWMSSWNGRSVWTTMSRSSGATSAPAVKGACALISAMTMHADYRDGRESAARDAAGAYQWK